MNARDDAIGWAQISLLEILLHHFQPGLNQLFDPATLEF